MSFTHSPLADFARNKRKKAPYRTSKVEKNDVIISELRDGSRIIGYCRDIVPLQSHGHEQHVFIGARANTRQKAAQRRVVADRASALETAIACSTYFTQTPIAKFDTESDADDYVGTLVKPILEDADSQ